MKQARTNIEKLTESKQNKKVGSSTKRNTSPTTAKTNNKSSFCTSNDKVVIENANV